MKRRQYLGSIAVGAAGFLVGCTDSEGTNGQEEEECRMVERTRMVSSLDEIESVSAGSGVTWRFDVEEDERLIISARLIDDGARPALTVENPSGAIVADIGPSERIQHEVTAREEGRYYVRFENEARLTSGQWDLDAVLERDYEEEVCN